MSSGLYSGVSGLALGTGLYKNTPGFWSGSSGFDAGFGSTSPYSGSSLYLDFLSGTLDPRITFSRGSQATLVDSTGKITYAPNNVLTYSQEFDNAAWGKTAIAITANTAVAPNGTLTADTFADDATNTSHTMIDSVSPIVIGAAYALSVYAKASTASALQVLGRAGTLGTNVWATFNLSTGTVGASGTATTASIVAVGDGWYRCTVVGVATATGTGAFALALTNNNPTAVRSPSYAGSGQAVFIWGAQLEQVTYQTTPSTYNATTTSAYYGPRFDYDPVTLAPKGLLIEEQRTNSVTYSDQFNNAAWTLGSILAFGSGSTANAIISPDGTQNADLLTPDTTLNAHRIYNNSAVISTTSVALSAYVKANGYTKVGLRESLATGAGAAFDLSNGTVLATYSAAGGTASNAAITPVGNGWYRISCTVAIAVATSLSFGVHVLSPSYTSGDLFASWTPNGTSGIYVYGAQLEAGAFATSYIPTVASTVTRSADTATMTGTNFSSWYNQTQGTFVTEADSLGYSSNNMLIAVSDSGTTNSVQQYLTDAVSSRFLIRTGGADQTSLTATVSASAVNKLASAYAASNFALAANGGTVLTSATGTVPTVDRIGIGSRLASLVYNGHIRAIAYYNTRLPNSQLQTLTAPTLNQPLLLDFTGNNYTVGY